MRLSTFLLFTSICFGMTESHAKERTKLLFASDMPFDRLLEFYVDLDWIHLQLENATFSRFGDLYDESENITIDRRKNFVIFNQRSEENGGAILGNNVILSNNEGILILYGNSCMATGSAINARQTVRITQNKCPCLFINNTSYNGKTASASGYGSCIYANNIIIENNPGLVLFKNNHVNGERNGGALGFTHSCVIRESGPIVFENNQAKWGGAISVSTANTTQANPCRLHIFADYGNIIFNNNTNEELKRNAIHCQKNHELQFGAKQGFSVCFYDTVEAGHPTPLPVLINPEADHLGTVLFSGATIQKDLPFAQASLISPFRNTIQVRNGVLAIEDDAFLRMNQLQTQNGIVRLGKGGIIASAYNLDSNVAANINISKLALNLPSLLTPDALPPKLWLFPKNNSTEDQGPYTEVDAASITVSGDLCLFDDRNQPPYDSVDLSQKLSKVPLLYLCENENKKINITNFNVDAINHTEHYGYQGVWAPWWEEYESKANSTFAKTANTKHRMLFAHWTPTGYIPNPQNISYLIPHVLWSSVHTVLSYMLNTSFPFSVFQMQGHATRTLYRQNNKNSFPGFSIASNGYQVEAASSSVFNHQLALQIGQNFSKTHEHNSPNWASSKHYTGALRFSSTWFHSLLETSAKFVYSYSDHYVHHMLSNKDALSNGFATTLGSSLSLLCPIYMEQAHTFIAPFIKANAIHSKLSAFIENNTSKYSARSFKTETPFFEVMAPIGLSIQPLNQSKYISWSASFAYQPIVYKQNSEIRTTLLISNGSWVVSGINMDRHAFVTEASVALCPTSFLQLRAEYEGSFSSTSKRNHITCGGAIYF